MRQLLIMAVLLMGLNSLPAQAGFKSGNDLAGECTAEHGLDWGICHGYILGVTDMFDMDHVVSTYGDTDGPRECTPANATAGQVKKVVVQYMDQNPQILHNSAYMVVQNALIDAFDCDTDHRYPL